MTYNMYVYMYIWIYSVYKVDYGGASATKKKIVYSFAKPWFIHALLILIWE